MEQISTESSWIRILIFFFSYLADREILNIYCQTKYFISRRSLITGLKTLKYLIELYECWLTPCHY